MPEIIYRKASDGDAPGMTRVLAALYQAGLRRLAVDEDWVRARYLDDPDRVLLQVAFGPESQILGFQSLKRAGSDNPYDTPLGWGIIGTHIAPEALRQGIGRRFFEASKQAAHAAGLPAIEAGVGIDVPHAQAYYTAMAFESYRQDGDVDFKVYRIRAEPR